MAIMDKLQWFKFSPSSWMMGRIQRCSEIAQARFMRLCCSYWNHGCNMTFDDAKLDVDEDILKELIDKKVITSDNEYIYISFLDDQYLECEKSSEKGKLFALKRWNPEEYNKAMGMATDRVPKGKPMGTHKEPNAEKKREEEKREDKIIIKSFEFFWDKYPKKVAKNKVKAKFMKLSEKDRGLIFTTIDSFISYKPFESYTHPNPETYINQERWNDQLGVVKKYVGAKKPSF